MTPSRRLVLDANILLRGVFGVRVADILTSFQENVDFYSPESCVAEACRHVPRIARTKGLDLSRSLAELEELVQLLIHIVDHSFYEALEQQALARISQRDPDDWPVVATALLLNAPIWTEDQDFFGSGIATWTSDRVELYLREK
jgi:predicted nucleic acid-binding protein